MNAKRSRGQPAYDDDKALEEIRRIRLHHPKWSITKAALHYAGEHPEEKATAASVARRLADKLRRKMGRPTQPRARRARLLQELRSALLKALSVLEALINLEGGKL